MVSSTKTIVFERLPNDTAQAMASIVDLDDVPITKKKKHIGTTKETALLGPEKAATTTTTPIAIPKTIVFPTSSTPIRHLFKTPITLTIGPHAHPFALHLEALLSCSPFFTAAFNPHYAFRESLTSALHLPEISPTDFEYFTQWLYRRSLDHESLSGPHPAYFRLIKLWKVADLLQVPLLKNAIIDTLCRIADATNSVPTPDDTRALFGNDVGEDMAKLGALTVDLFVWKKTGHLIGTHPDSWDERFLRCLVVALKEQQRGGEGGGGGGGAPWGGRGERCRRYHVHDQWAPVEGCEGAVGKWDGEVAVTVKGRAGRKRRSAAPSPN